MLCLKKKKSESGQLERVLLLFLLPEKCQDSLHLIVPMQNRKEKKNVNYTDNILFLLFILQQCKNWLCALAPQNILSLSF